MDYNKEFNELEQSGINRLDYGMQEFKKVVLMKRRGFITKKEYNEKRREIEQQLFGIA